MKTSPLKCPCCDGWGTRLVWSTTSMNADRVPCPACKGTGVIWAVDIPDPIIPEKKP